MRDYSERRQSRITSPPRRPPVWPYVLLISLLILIAYGAGLGTGWYLYRPGGQFYKAPQISQPAPTKTAPTLPPQGEPIAPAPSQKQPAAEQPGGVPPLTFYNTLQKGNKVLMGTGINEPKEIQQKDPSKPLSVPPPER